MFLYAFVYLLCYVRFEWQLRGSVHLHALLWSLLGKNADELVKTEEGRAKLAEMVERVYTAWWPIGTSDGSADQSGDSCDASAATMDDGDAAPTTAVNNETIVGTAQQHARASISESESGSNLGNNNNPLRRHTPLLPSDAPEVVDDLMKLLGCVQTHKCGNSCWKKQPGLCRFKFPKALRDKTIIEMVYKNGALEMRVYAKRNKVYLNNYNHFLLRTWRANIDIQFCGNPHGAAVYVAYYASKNEPSGKFLHALRTRFLGLDRTTPMNKVLHAMAQEQVRARSFSASEAIWILKSYTYTELSRKVVQLNILPPEERQKVLRKRAALAELDKTVQISHIQKRGLQTKIMYHTLADQLNWRT